MIWSKTDFSDFAEKPNAARERLQYPPLLKPFSWFDLLSVYRPDKWLLKVSVFLRKLLVFSLNCYISLALGQDWNKDIIVCKVSPPTQAELISESLDTVEHWSQNLSDPICTCNFPSTTHTSWNLGLLFWSVGIGRICLNV